MLYFESSGLFVQLLYSSNLFYFLYFLFLLACCSCLNCLLFFSSCFGLLAKTTLFIHCFRDCFNELINTAKVTIVITLIVYLSHILAGFLCFFVKRLKSKRFSSLYFKISLKTRFSHDPKAETSFPREQPN